MPRALSASRSRRWQMTWPKSALRTKVCRRSFCAWRNRALCGLLNLSVWKSNEAEMSESHHAYLSLGSNIRPETNLAQAIALLQNYGRIEKISSAWESESVGAEGPNYLNACVLLVTPLLQSQLKKQALRPIERELGR